MPIELYTWSTPNGRKVSIMLEELALPYHTHPINIGKGDQLTPQYVAINPNSKIPAIVDSEGPDGKPISIMESGAILIYLAEKTGKLIPASPRARSVAMQWLMFQMGHVGPMFGQVHHFLRSAKEPAPYAIERYTKEKDRPYGGAARRRGREKIPRRRVFDRRHRHLSLGRALRMAQDGFEQLSQRKTLVRRDRREA